MEGNKKNWGNKHSNKRTTKRTTQDKHRKKEKKQKNKHRKENNNNKKQPKKGKHAEQCKTKTKKNKEKAACQQKIYTNIRNWQINFKDVSGLVKQVTTSASAPDFVRQLNKSPSTIPLHACCEATHQRILLSCLTKSGHQFGELPHRVHWWKGSGELSHQIWASIW